MSTPTPSIARRAVVSGACGLLCALLLASGVALVSAERPSDLLPGLLLGCAVALVAAAPLLLWGARRVVQPVDDVVRAAVRASGGERGAVLDPDRPATDLGRIAVAFDDVLAQLDAGLQVAAKLERRSGTFETRWRQVLEAAAEAYLAVDPSGVIVDVNQRTVALLGLPREQLCGRPAALLVPERYRAGLVQTISEIAAEGVLPAHGPYDLQGVARDGSEFPVECTVWAVDRRGGTVVHAFVRDVSERRHAQEVTARLAAVIEGSFDAMVAEDLSGTIRTWNHAAEGIFGWSEEEAIGRDVGLIVPEVEREQHRAAVGRVARGEQVFPSEGERLTCGGTAMPVSVRLSPVYDRHGAVVGVSSLLRDITEQRWMAEALDSSLAALQEAVEEARTSEATTRRFLADAAHQLRTPVAGISACAETLLRGVDAEDSDRLLASMVRETSRAARLISGLLHMARLDQGLPMQRGPVDVVALCKDEVARIGLLAPHLSVSLEVRHASAGPLLLDAGACQELLSNLGDNALRHAAGRVVLKLAWAAGRLRIAVVDDGPGVPEEARDRVFERFVSLDGAGGSGLGLPIARGLARSLGGDLRYEAGFVLDVPAEVARESCDGGDRSGASAESTSLSPSGSSSRRTA